VPRISHSDYRQNASVFFSVFLWLFTSCCQCCGSGIRDWEKSRSRIRGGHPRSYFCELCIRFKFLNADPDPGSCQLWIRDQGWKNRIRIRDKHPGSATLVVVLVLERLCKVLRMIFRSNIFYPLCGFFCSMPSVICGNVWICPIFFVRIMILLRNYSCQIFPLCLLIDHVFL